MTKEQEQTIIEMYQNGENAVQISKIVNLHSSTISRFVKKIGISRGRYSKKRLDNENNIIKDFVENKLYCEDLAKKYNLDVHTIYNILDKHNIKRQTGYHSKCQEDFFEKIDTPDKAYILGFITADGNVSKNKKSVSIEVQEKDAEVLEYIANLINPEVARTKSFYGNKRNIRISFGAKKLGEDLEKYGVIPNKSLILEKVPKEFISKELLPFYFRGLIDGDGCILENGRVSIYSGSKKFIEDVQNILVKKLELTQLKIYHGTTYFISWSKKEDRQKLFNYLYSDLNSAYYYKRKYIRLFNSLYSS